MYRMILEKINFEEVINPHYAFPIVGVLLCALLVFAFGFKTPAQPPSFDFVEVQHRKATSKKKQKSKEKQPKLVQNGAVQNQSRLPTDSSDSNDKSDSKPAPKSRDLKEKHTQPTKVIPTKTVPSKAVPTKAQSVKGQPTKSDSKNKNKKTFGNAKNRNNQVETEEALPPPPAEEAAGGEWAQILSRKEKKNRKKDENITIEVGTLLSTDNSGSKKKKKKGSNDAPVKESFPEPVKVIEIAKPVVAKIEPKVDTTPEQKIKPNKVEKKEIPLPETPPKKQKDTAKPDETPAKANKAPEPEKAPKSMESVKSRPNDDKSVEKEETAVEVKSEKKDDTNQDSSNVVFDELGDMWQDAKPQKKKKKVRKE